MFGRQLLGGTGSVLRKSNSISTTRTRHRAEIEETAMDRLEIKRRPRHYINCNIYFFFFLSAMPTQTNSELAALQTFSEGYCLRDRTV